MVKKVGEKKKNPSTYSLNESSSDFRSLGIQCNSHRPVGDGIRGKALCSFSHILDCALMILAREKKRLKRSACFYSTTYEKDHDAPQTLPKLTALLLH